MVGDGSSEAISEEGKVMMHISVFEYMVEASI